MQMGRWGNVVLVMIVAAAMVFPVSQAYGQSDWETLATDSSIDTLAYDLSRLVIRGSDVRSHRTLGVTFFSLDDAPVGDGLRTVVFARGSQMRRVEGVPAAALDETAILNSNGHIVWAVQRDTSARYDVYELDVALAKAVRRFENLFLGSASRVEVMTDGDRTYYFEISGVKTLSNGFPPVSVQSITLGNNDTTEVNKIWRNAYETIEDVTTDGRVLTLIVFENGDQELWYHAGGLSRAIPDSYTINGYLLGAQFVGNQVEFFRYQRLMRYDPATVKTEALSDRIVWEKSVLTQGERLFAHNGVLLYVAYDDVQKRHEVMRRKSGVSTRIGSWSGGPLLVRRGLVQFRRDDVYASGTNVFDTATGQEQFHSGGVSLVDVWQGAVAATDTRAMGSVAISGATVSIGSADDMAVIDATHTWVVRDGRIWLLTIKPHAFAQSSTVQFGKFANASTVFLLSGGTRRTVLNEATYRSWRPDFFGLVTLDRTNEHLYRDIGIAPYATGTMLKMADAPAVWRVTNEWGRVLIPDESTAYALYGDAWWREVKTVSGVDMARYRIQ